jgi:hypothetical protein
MEENKVSYGYALMDALAPNGDMQAQLMLRGQITQKELLAAKEYVNKLIEQGEVEPPKHFNPK